MFAEDCTILCLEYNKGGYPFKVWRHLLGIDWCHTAFHKEVLQSDKKTPFSENSEKQYVETNSGMAGVVPVWKTMEFINREGSVIEKKREKRGKSILMPRN